MAVTDEIQIGITIPREIYEYKKENGLAWKELLILGYKNHKKDIPYYERIADIEERLKKLEVKVSSLSLGIAFKQ